MSKRCIFFVFFSVIFFGEVGRDDNISNKFQCGHHTSYKTNFSLLGFEIMTIYFYDVLQKHIHFYYEPK